MDNANFHKSKNQSETPATDEELAFRVWRDALIYAIQRIVDMPERRLNLLIRLCVLNGGHLPTNERSHFAELTDDELGRMVNAIASALPQQPLL